MSADRGRVLLADDDLALRNVLRRTLQKWGFFVESVGNGRDAANALGARHFDVLLCDINMPGNAKLELLEHIRGQQLLLPVVLMTGEPTIDSAVGALRHGVVDYITKPLDYEELLMLLDDAINKGRAVHALATAKERAAVFTQSVTALELAMSVSGRARPTASAPPAAAQADREPSADPLSYLTADELMRLSQREREITRLLALGNAISRIATTLDLSTNTVRNHIKSIFVKMGVHSQIALLSKLAGHAR